MDHNKINYQIQNNLNYLLYKLYIIQVKNLNICLNNKKNAVIDNIIL
jgi:hypothetical protein